MVTELAHLREAVATFAAACANKLRGQHAVAGSVTVYLSVNRFKGNLPMHRNSLTLTLPAKTSDTIETTKSALQLLDSIYRPGIWYKKAGVVVGEISTDACIQQYLYDKIQNRKQRQDLMKAVDRINHTMVQRPCACFPRV